MEREVEETQASYSPMTERQLSQEPETHGQEVLPVRGIYVVYLEDMDLILLLCSFLCEPSV